MSDTTDFFDNENRQGYIWVLDNGSGDVFRITTPDDWSVIPDKVDTVDWIDAQLPDDVRLKDCQYMFTYNPHPFLY
jgi:hypothetical protein